MANIKFYPFNQETVDFTPAPQPAYKHLPDWYKLQPGYIGDEKTFLSRGMSSSTVKRCMPMYDVISSGYMIYFPCDIFIDATNPEKLLYSVPEGVKSIKNTLFSFHSEQQVSHYPRETDMYHKEIFRILPFWSAGTDKGYSCLFTQPFHREPAPFKLFSAVIDTDNYISDGFLSMYIKKDFRGTIERGTPLAQIIPFKRDSYEMSLAGPEEANILLSKQRFLVRSKFSNFYRNHMRQRKDYK
jgi:hypothetical protein